MGGTKGPGYDHISDDPKNGKTIIMWRILNQYRVQNQVLGSLKITLCEERGLKNTQSLIWEDRRLQKLSSFEDWRSATRPKEQRFTFLTDKIWLFSVIDWEDDSWWYLHQDHHMNTI